MHDGNGSCTPDVSRVDLNSSRHLSKLSLNPFETGNRGKSGRGYGWVKSLVVTTGVAGSAAFGVACSAATGVACLTATQVACSGATGVA